MSDYTPTTDVIRHWVAWTYNAECPEEFIEHDHIRVKQFNSWLQVQLDKARAEGVLEGRNFELGRQAGGRK